MESYIPISYLNDFVFCPRSIYYHQLYGNLSTRLYHTLPQVRGKAAHDAIEKGRYSTRKNVLQAIEVYSERLGLCGKIDIFDIDAAMLTERKKRIIQIYDGYVFQLYAQYYALVEMGYSVEKLRLYSCDDNKVYPVSLPDNDVEMKKRFENLLLDMQTYRLSEHIQTNPEKCKNCIYEPLCDQSLC